MKKFGYLITSLVLLLSPISAIAGIGDAYNCKVIDGVVAYPNGMKRFSDEYLTDPIMSQDKFVWLEKSISVKYVQKDLIIPIETQNEESFDAYDGYHKLSFSDGFLIWSSQGHHPTGYSMSTHHCKKF